MNEKLKNDVLNNFFDSQDALFHYTRLYTALEHILRDGKIKFSLYRNSHDPKESSFLFLNQIGAGNVFDSPCIEDKILKTQIFFDKILRDESRILCFCLNKKNMPGYFRARMWSQYADAHKGVCLVFSKKKLVENIRNKIKNVKNCNIIFYYKKVQYKNNLSISYDAATIDVNLLKEMDIVKYVYHHIKQHYKEFFFLKSIDYRDENEYRFVIIPEKNQEAKEFEFLDIHDSLRGIILGNDFPEVCRSVIDEVKEKYKNCEIRQLLWSRNTWEPMLGIYK